MVVALSVSGVPWGDTGSSYHDKHLVWKHCVAAYEFGENMSRHGRGMNPGGSMNLNLNLYENEFTCECSMSHGMGSIRYRNGIWEKSWQRAVGSAYHTLSSVSFGTAVSGLTLH